MNRMKRILLVSSSVILLALGTIIGSTYALFTDSVSVGNHLQAGSLDVALERTHLAYSVLNAEGKLEEYESTEKVDFSAVTEENVFGLTDGAAIVPGSYFDAELLIKNNGNVALDYTVEIKLKDGSDESLAEQLRVTVTLANGDTVQKMLSEMVSGVSLTADEALEGGSAESFRVKVEFVDDRVDNTVVNNDAMAKAVNFDLYVIAVQSTVTAD